MPLAASHNRFMKTKIKNKYCAGFEAVNISKCRLSALSTDRQLLQLTCLVLNHFQIWKCSASGNNCDRTDKVTVCQRRSPFVSLCGWKPWDNWFPSLMPLSVEIYTLLRDSSRPLSGQLRRKSYNHWMLLSPCPKMSKKHGEGAHLGLRS